LARELNDGAGPLVHCITKHYSGSYVGGLEFKAAMGKGLFDD
jgi:hypothetical protein